MQPASIGGSRYALGIMDDYTAKSNIYFLTEKSEVTQRIIAFKTRSENTSGFRLINARLNGAGGNISTDLKAYCTNNGIRLDYSPPYAPQSNGLAEMQELGMRSRVLPIDSKLPKSLWAEAMSHGSWLRKKLPAERINRNLPILPWDSRTRIDYGSLPRFGQPGFSFIYGSTTSPDKKLGAKAHRGHFVGLQSEESKGTTKDIWIGYIQIIQGK